MAFELDKSAGEVLDREFLEIRCRLIEIGAALDRIDRAAGDVGDDPRLEQVLAAIDTLANRRDSRAEQIQRVFSRSFDEGWRSEFGI